MAVPRPEPGLPDDPEHGDDATAERGGPDGAVVTSDHADTGSVFPAASNDRPGWHVRLFGSHEFFRLWLVQVVSATGDWLGFSAIIVLATRIGGTAGAGAVSLVMAARIIPGFFFGPVAGVLVDRWDRKKVMVACDVGRAVVLASLLFVDSIVGLVIASLLLEVFTLLWSPAKDAEVPNLVPHDHLTTANSLSLAAAYGTFPFASALFALLAAVSVWLGDVPALAFLDSDQVALAFVVDAFTFLFSAWMIHRLTFGQTPPPDPETMRTRAVAGSEKREIKAALRRTLGELREGWREILDNHTVRAVNLGLACGLIGGGMLIPLGAVFSAEVLGAGAAGYGLFITALGFGVAVGAVGVSLLQKRLPAGRVFTTSLFAAGLALFAAASSSTLPVAAAFVFLMGVSVGPVYVLGFSMLQTAVPDDKRGRVFSSLNTLVRLCVLVSMVVGPLVAALLGRMSTALVGGEVTLLGVTIPVPGVRLALWLASAIIIGAGVAAWTALRAGERILRARASSHPSRYSRP
ncbi:MAG: MFS transporter [Acidimicrobiales bacterium]|nr:MFS transporter [Acidimicrobiales bacterium]